MKKLVLAALATGVILTGCQADFAHKNASKSTALASSTQTITERNKANALAFYDLAFNQHQLQKAVDLYVGQEYLQHNPHVADGGQAFIDAFTPYIKQFPNTKATIKRAVAEGDLVMLHVHSQTSSQDKGQAVVDIFRFDKNGKIVEHWDVIQDVPEKLVSGRTMFD